MNVIKNTLKRIFKKTITAADLYDDRQLFNYGLQGLWEIGDSNITLKDAYRNPIVRACLKVIVDSVASVPLAVKKKDSSGNYIVDAKDNIGKELLALLNRPNNVMSRNRLLEYIVLHLELYGNAYIAKSILKDRVIELWILAPDKVKVKPSKRDFIGGYEFSSTSTGSKLFKLEEVVHIMSTSPHDFFYGQSQIDAGSAIIGVSTNEIEWQRSVLQRGSIIAGILGVKNRITETQRKALEKRLDDFGVEGSRAGKDMVIGSDLTYERLGATFQEMGLVDARRLSQESICSLLRVPPPMVGFYENATLSNIKQAEGIFWTTRIFPLLRQLEDAINYGITPHFGDDLEVVFDTSSVKALQPTDVEKSRTFSRFVESGVSPEAASRYLNLGFQSQDFVEPETIAEKHAPVTKVREQYISETERRGMIWKAVDTVRRELEDALSSELITFYEKERDEVSGAIANHSELNETLSIGITLAVTRLVGDMKKIMNRGAKSVTRVVIGTSPIKNSIPDLKELIELSTYIEEVIQSSTSLISQNTKIQLLAAFQEAEDINSLTGKVQQIYDGYVKTEGRTPRAVKIARTEVGKYYNGANYFTAKYVAETENVNMLKTWISTRDSRVRSSHQAVDGEEIPINQVYSNGLRFPNDPQGKADEVVSCRCTQFTTIAG